MKNLMKNLIALAVLLGRCTVALAASGSATPATGADQAEVTITDDD